MGWKVHLSARINDYRQILPDKFMRCPLNPFKFPLLAPFCHRLMEQCFEHRFYSMESDSSQIEVDSITIQLLASIPTVIKITVQDKIEAVITSSVCLRMKIYINGMKV